MRKIKLPAINAMNFKNTECRIDKDILSRWQPDIKAANDDANTITIYEAIGEDYFGSGFTARKMAALLRSMDGKDIVVSINSPGGDYFEGATIYNLLREYSGRVTVKVPGLAASAASVIAMAADVIQISEIGFLMIHNSWGIVVGNRNEMRDAADIFEKFDSAMADIYVARTGMDRDEIVKMLDKTTWMNGSESIEKGFADELMPGKEVDGAANDGKKSQAMARRSIEMALARTGYSRKEREDVFKNAFGSRDAAESVERDADYKDEDIQELIKTLKS